MKPVHSIVLFSFAVSLGAAPDQTQVGAGNSRAEQIGHGSPLVRTSFQTLVSKVEGINDNKLRNATLDALQNPNTCVAHRANLTAAQRAEIVNQLIQEHLVNPNDGNAIPGGLAAGIFPPILRDGSPCPHLPIDFYAAPGSGNNSHHAYPGGLSVHEAFNQQNSIDLAALYRSEYGQPNRNGLPVYRGEAERGDADVRINQNVVVAAPAWHDWAKTIVFQWNADGSEFVELNFGGSGTNDNNGAAGDSRTGGHHIIGIAEAMVRGLSPEFVITQASAHSAPTLGNEYKVVNWLRAAAIMARIDPVANGYLTKDSGGNYRLPALKQLDSFDLLSANQSNLLIEYQIHNLSDADFVNSIPAVTSSLALLAELAPEFGYSAADTANYNNKFRNVVLSYLSAERLEMIYGHAGLDGIRAELNQLRSQNLI